ncbi:MAG TPA: hypothetical protein VKG64_20175 [Methylomirabilota bacterium]|nr:hypothetical protein [Methylomirabilota bacterium]
MTQSLAEHIQRSRLMVVEVNRAEGRLRVRGEAGACTELSCSSETLVVTDENSSAGLDALNPGDIIKVEPASGRLTRIVVLRRAWDELASPEV